MRIRTLLNKCEYLKSFVYVREYWERKGNQRVLIVDIEARKNARPICTGCIKRCSIYDHSQSARDFRFVPLWGISTYFRYTLRRVDCPDCGVKVEQIPWAKGKSPITHSFGFFLSQWAKRLSWKEVADTFHVHWNTVYQVVSAVVDYMDFRHESLTGLRRWVLMKFNTPKDINI